MQKYINHIKTKPEHIRRKAALVICGIACIILLIIFFLTFSARVKEKGFEKERSGAELMKDAYKDTVSDLQTIW